MALVKGPFEIKYGVDVLAGIESIDFEYEVNTDDFETIQGNTYEIVKSHKVTVVATFLESDVASLAVVLPQYFVANGGTLSTGETVNDADGAIDIVPGGCDYVATTTDVVITSCGNPGHVVRIPDCETEIDSIEADGVIKVSVKFKGMSSDATVQMFGQGAVSIVS
jgi:hypothetical protein